MEHKQLTKKQKRYNKYYKRWISFLLSFIFIVTLSWLLIIVAIITKITSRGPIIFKQKRYGKDLKVFTIYKFRSMKINSINIPTNNITHEQQEEMVTKWGKIMRLLSLDELPQLFNIMKGDMAFIGPRPGQSSGEDDLKEARLLQPYNPYDVRPGLSGYAQIKAIDAEHHDPEKKASKDSYYVEHMSLWLDIKLLFGTIIFILRCIF